MTKPAKIKLKAVMWRLLQSGKVVTYDELQELAGVSRSYAQEWMATLIKREVVRKLSKGRYQLIDDACPESEAIDNTTHLKFQSRPRSIAKRTIKNLPETKIWQAILRLKKFYMTELVAENLGNKTTVYQYCAALARAGYLKKDFKASKGSSCLYTLERVTGDVAPITMRALYLYDYNTDEIWNDIPESREIKKHLL